MFKAIFTAALVLSAIPAIGHTQSKEVLNADLITVSGRFQFANAKGRLTEAKLKLGDVHISPDVSAVLGMTETDFKATYLKALAKSLTNYQHLSPETDSPPIIVNLSLSPVSYVPEKEASTAKFELVLNAQTEDQALKSCLTYTAKSEFKALRRISDNNGQRALGVFIVVLAPLSGGGFMAAQFMEASEKDKAFNADRAVSAYEGVTPDNNAEKTKKFAYVNAIQLVNINLIQHLGQAQACAAPHVAQVMSTSAETPVEPVIAPATETAPSPAPQPVPTALQTPQT